MPHETLACWSVCLKFANTNLQHDQNCVLRRHDPLWPLPLLKTLSPGLDDYFRYETTATRNKQTANIAVTYIFKLVVSWKLSIAQIAAHTTTFLFLSQVVRLFPAGCQAAASTVAVCSDNTVSGLELS